VRRSGVAARSAGPVPTQNHQTGHRGRVKAGEAAGFTCRGLALWQDPPSPARPDPGPAEAEPVTAAPAAAITSGSGVFSCSALEAV
jgi:hypothetical protein